MADTMPVTISASLDTVLKNFGNILGLERRGDVDAGEIWKLKMLPMAELIEYVSLSHLNNYNTTLYMCVYVCMYYCATEAILILFQNVAKIIAIKYNLK